MNNDYSVVQKPLHTVLPTLSANLARQAELHFHQLPIFSLSHHVLTLFLESCYDASILFAPDKTKTLARPSPSSRLSLSETELPPSPIVSCSASPLPLLSFTSWHTVQRMRSWPGRPQVVVMTLLSLHCPLKADAARIRFHTMVH